MRKHYHWGKQLAAGMIAGLLLLSGCSGTGDDADTTGSSGDAGGIFLTSIMVAIVMTLCTTLLC
ncbi:MAG: hypothetical protein LUG47_03295 [Clostridiales bacterium]|nr:hypothetical protein [Clostridiales bacterium]